MKQQGKNETKGTKRIQMIRKTHQVRSSNTFNKNIGKNSIT